MKLKRELGLELEYVLSRLRDNLNSKIEIEKMLKNPEISKFQKNILLKFKGDFDYNKEKFMPFSSTKKALLKLRKKINKKRPKFVLFGYDRLKRIPKGWRLPRGSQSKQRRCVKGRPKMAGVGYRGPKLVRQLNSKGYPQIRVFNIADLSKLINKKDTIMVQIAGCVGLKKRVEMENYAVENNLHVSNCFVIN